MSQGLDLQFRMTRSVLDEFVEEHDASDVLRELVQNEFDALGTRMEIVFGADSLSVRGNGRPYRSRQDGSDSALCSAKGEWLDLTLSLSRRLMASGQRILA